MSAITGVYEVAVRVKDLERSEAFYCGVLGLESGLRDESRRWHFLRRKHGPFCRSGSSPALPIPTLRRAPRTSPKPFP